MLRTKVMKLFALAVLLAALPLPAQARGFAVVELFTSEGCSSCPPADRLLAELAGRPNVYALEFHVDYWNSLGWRDPFSAAAFTDRQRGYDEALGEDVYTPQMVVNGTTAFVGSNRAQAEAAIARALAAAPSASLTATVANGLLTYRAVNAPAHARLGVAVVDSSRTVHVGRGENGGRTLTHVRVVRKFTSVPVSATGSGTIPLPAAIPAGGSVVAFVEDGAIVAVAEAR